jgi:pyruvoyl-dependent arginine decarboxylase (PvlArgDC)
MLLTANIANNYNLIFVTNITPSEWKNVSKNLAQFLCHFFFFFRKTLNFL